MPLRNCSLTHLEKAVKRVLLLSLLSSILTCCQELVGALSERYPDSEQFASWLNGSERDSNIFDWHDALNRTDMLMTMIKQYTEVC